MRLLLLLTHLLVAAANAKNSYTRIDDTDMSDFTPGEGPSWLARVSGALEHDILDGELPGPHDCTATCLAHSRRSSVRASFMTDMHNDCMKIHIAYRQLYYQVP